MTKALPKRFSVSLTVELDADNAYDAQDKVQRSLYDDGIDVSSFCTSKRVKTEKETK